MGNNIFSITKCNSNNIPASFNPSNYEWLSVHSLETGLSIVEVQRLWVRFQQLGCDKNGMWNQQVSSQSVYKIAKDEFTQNIINQLHAPGQQQVTFYDFLNAVLWLEKSSIDDKLKASFALINNNQPVTVATMTKLLVSMFPGKKKADIDMFISDLFDRYGVDNVQTKVKEIFEDDFVYFLRLNVGRDQLDELFRFKVFPSLRPATDETQSPRMDVVGGRGLSGGLGVPTEHQLDEVARLIGDRDVGKLAGLLGLLEYDVSHLENVHRANRFKIVASILREWKQKEGARALFTVLKRALYLGGFQDIFNRMELG